MAMIIHQFPAQKKLLKEKTEAWGIENIEAGITITTGDSSKIRQNKRKKQINYDLINGIIDESDIETAFNPQGIKGVKFPAKIQNYPIEISKFNVLKGEESRRRFEWRLRSVNEDVISQKEFLMQGQIESLIMEEIQNPNYSEDQIQRRMKQLEHYQKYEYQDTAEVMGSRILDYFWYSQKLKDKFSSSFYDVLVAAEEMFSVNIVHGEPIAVKENPLNVSTFGSGDSIFIEDSDIIVQDGYTSVGKLIDEFWDVLTSTEIDELETGSRANRNMSQIVFAGPLDEGGLRDVGTSQLITIDGHDSYNYGGSFDSDGNIRRTRVVWKSRRKIGELTYYGPEGEELKTIIDENFPVDNFKTMGWTVKWYWINEWWQGFRIGKDMYKRIEPLPRIGTKFSNPSVCLPPFVGTIYSIGGGESVSLMDRVKPYKYLYNVYMRRTELASARNKGVLAELDLAEIPDGWDEELVMMYAEANGYMIKDSFKEGKKGVAMGKLVSTIKQRGSDTLNLNSSDIIRANLELARYVKLELGEIAGVSPQREGQIDNRETYGGVERAVTQSSHITEEWFRIHDGTKIRVMELLLETGKYAWRNATGENAKKLQYVDDGLVTHMFTVDGRQLKESEYGYYISDGQNDADLIQAIKGLTQAAMQNDKLQFSDLFTIYRDTSISSMIRKVEYSEEKRNQREDDARKENIEAQERAQAAMQKLEMMKLEQTWRIEEAKIQADITMKQMDIELKMLEIENKAIGQDEEKKYQHEIDKLKLQINQRKLEMEEKSRQFAEKLKSMEDLTDKQIKSSEKIAASRPKKETIK